MDIDLPKWNKIAEVQWKEKPLLFFERENSVLMLLAEKRQDRTIGFACSACKPFVVNGDSSKLDLVNFSNEVTLVKKLNAGQHASFLLTFTNPTYVQFSKNSLMQAADMHLKQLSEASYDVKNAYDVALKEPSPEENPLLVDSSFIFSFLSLLRSSAKRLTSSNSIGLDLRGEKVLCSVPSLSLGVVAGGTREQRLHCLHLLSEEALLQNACVLIFDSRNAFLGLSKASNFDLSEFTAFSLQGLPAGFPLREITPGKNAFVSLSSFSPSSLLAPFGLHDLEISKYLALFLEKNSFENTELTQFTGLKVQRIGKLLLLLFQGIFSDNVSPEFSHSFGKVLRVDLSKCSQEAAAFFAMGLLQQLEKTSKEKQVFLLFEQDASQVKTLVEMAVDKFLGSNVSILCHCEDENDVPFVKSADFFVEVIDKDVALTVAGKPPQRVKLRPAYSACSER